VAGGGDLTAVGEYGVEAVQRRYNTVTARRVCAMSSTRFTDVRRFDSIDSTNRYLLAEARSGAPEGVVAVADFQTAGRGRLGRRWEAPAGSNLLLSALLRPELPVVERHLSAAAMALAAADSSDRVAGVDLGLKWPNDLLGPDGRKVAGILAESDTPGQSGGPGPAPAIVVGIGINVNWPLGDADLPQDLAGSVSSLSREAGRELDRDELLAALLDALDPLVDDLGTADGRSRVAEAYRSRCTTIGAAVRVDLAGGSFEGRASGITRGGHLVVETSAGPRTVVAADVVHLRTTAGAPAPGPASGGL
jgi:BirA family transcriptional regulator, biotin operon repressor / biotin---[acetyl-CoA-carboxylase] ligase